MRAAFAKVKLQAPDDDSEFWQIFDALEKDPELDRLIGAVGYHYVDGREPWEIDQKGGRDATEKAKRSGKPLWASEEWSQSGGQWGDKGALYLARLMNKLYTRDRITKFEIWCPIDSIYDQIIWADTGAMQADTPWCGHYAVWPAVWAVAHTTQFAEPGWVYMDDACGQLDTNTWRGSHVALRDPKTGDWSVIVVTGEKRSIQITIAPGLKTGPVHVWKSTAAEQFVQQPPLPLRDDTVELELESDAIYTLTSTTGQQKGSHGTPPRKKAIPVSLRGRLRELSPGRHAALFLRPERHLRSLSVAGGRIVPGADRAGAGHPLVRQLAAETAHAFRRHELAGLRDRGRRAPGRRRCRNRRTLCRPRQTGLSLDPDSRRPLAAELAIHHPGRRPGGEVRPGSLASPAPGDERRPDHRLCRWREAGHRHR